MRHMINKSNYEMNYVALVMSTKKFERSEFYLKNYAKHKKLGKHKKRINGWGMLIL